MFEMFEILLGMALIWWATLIIYAIYYMGDEQMEDIKEQLIKADLALINSLEKDIVILEDVVNSQDKIIKMQRDMLDKTEAFVTKMKEMTSGKEESSNERI